MSKEEELVKKIKEIGDLADASFIVVKSGDRAIGGIFGNQEEIMDSLLTAIDDGAIEEFIRQFVDVYMADTTTKALKEMTIIEKIRDVSVDKKKQN